MSAVLADGDLPRERPGDSAVLRLRDGDRRHSGSTVRKRSAVKTQVLLRVSSSLLFPAVGDRAVRLQPALPPERADPGLGGPDLLQAPHPQSHHESSHHVLLCQHLLLHLLPAGQLFFQLKTLLTLI